MVGLLLFSVLLMRKAGCCHTGRLRANELFLLSETSDASFDSRYFGPITVDRVIGRARPLWTWAQPRGEQ